MSNKLRTLLENNIDFEQCPIFINLYLESVPLFNDEIHDIKGRYFIESIQSDGQNKRIYYVKEVVKRGVLCVAEFKTLLKAQNMLKGL